MKEKFEQSYRAPGGGINPRQTAVSESKWWRYGGKEHLPENDQEPRHHEDDYLAVDEIADVNALNPEQVLLLKEELQEKIDKIFTDPKFFAKWQAYGKFRDTQIEEAQRVAPGGSGLDIYNLLDATSLNDKEVLDFKEELQEMIDDIATTIKREKEDKGEAERESLPPKITANDVLSDKKFIVSMFEHGGHATARGIKDYLERFVGKNVMETKRETKVLDRGIPGVRTTHGGRSDIARRKSKAMKAGRKIKNAANN